MSVWLCIPSARPDGGTLPKWKAAGYKLAIWRDPGAPFIEADLIHEAKYQGYPRACNTMIRAALAEDPDCDWVVCGGDDTLPDPNRTPAFIAAQCEDYFMAVQVGKGGKPNRSWSSTFGVCQPTGDPWSDHMGRIIERIAGSPWIGRRFAETMYGGNGPWCEEYRHCFADEELQLVAQKLGVFWQRPDLTHMHHNWARARGAAEDMPAFLADANSQRHWVTYRSVFERRKAAGFPGSEAQ